MMSILFVMIFMIFIFNNLKMSIIQMLYQNLIFLMILYVIFMYPLSSVYWIMIYNYLGGDIYSIGLILLSLWIYALMIMVSYKNFLSLSYIMFLNMMNFLLIFLILSFYTMNLIMFYLFFESSLIPVFFLIMGWGYQIDRIQASFYMMLYTLFGSFPLLISILSIYWFNMTLSMLFIEIYSFNVYIYISLILAFLIKIPMYFVHLWLPKAHVEAPLVGSMILAGVMLKLGGYGLLRIMMMMMKMCVELNKIIIIMSLVGGVYSSLVCLGQSDMKMLVAYSSVVHMSMLISGFMTLYSMGYLGGYLMMIAHGLCSSGLFVLVNIGYERLNSRSLMLNKGLINFLPSLSLMWFLLCSSNMSFPPSLNLWSEILLLSCLIIWDKFMILLLLLVMFISSSYTLYLYSFSQHGWTGELMYLVKGIYIVEFMILMLHWLPLNFLFLIMYLFLNF